MGLSSYALVILLEKAEAGKRGAVSERRRIREMKPFFNCLRADDDCEFSSFDIGDIGPRAVVMSRRILLLQV